MDLICYSHLRWNFVYQRPQHLLSRFAKQKRVFYIEEPVFTNEENTNYYEISSPTDNLWLVVPHLQHNLSEPESIVLQQNLLTKLLNDYNINKYMFWYYTPMALLISKHLKPEFVVYDCMDELATFKFAPPALKELEKDLFEVADIVFTGGHNLHKAKKSYHHNIYPVPSSIDKEHFIKARVRNQDPVDQALITWPRFGFYGVVDERFDLQLLTEAAQSRPQWQFIIIGPVIKIDPATLPRLNNIHYLGSKTYNELPAYLSGWDVAMIPFLLNDSTKYISPTKTPEYLAAGRPVISTSIKDVVEPYAINGLVHIADSASDFIKAAEIELGKPEKKKWLSAVDALLFDNSWDNTWQGMVELIDNTLKENKNLLTNLNEEVYV
ncbi:MAG: glycosyltransferase family 1 protein [Ginsengibacter sp.]